MHCMIQEVNGFRHVCFILNVIDKHEIAAYKSVDRVSLNILTKEQNNSIRSIFAILIKAVLNLALRIVLKLSIYFKKELCTRTI